MCARKCREAVRFLCDNKADLTLLDSEGRSPIYFAVSFGHLPIVQTLIAHGVSVNQVRVVFFTFGIIVLYCIIFLHM